MAKKAERGTKRTCQNPECRARFYDLNRNPIVCPLCNSEHAAIAPEQLVAPAVAPVAEKVQRKPVKRPAFVPEGEAAPDEAAPEDTESLEALEDEDVAEADETFLEDDEEVSDDMTGIIGGGLAEDEEET
ncbi:MAG: FYDLN acid domain-containing protein [Hyphomicrobiaceae bacterium]